MDPFDTFHPPASLHPFSYSIACLYTQLARVPLLVLPTLSSPPPSIVPAISKPCTAPFLHALFSPRESIRDTTSYQLRRKSGDRKRSTTFDPIPSVFPRERVNRFLRKEEVAAAFALRCACGESVAAYEDQGIKGECVGGGETKGADGWKVANGMKGDGSSSER